MRWQEAAHHKQGKRSGAENTLDKKFSAPVIFRRLARPWKIYARGTRNPVPSSRARILLPDSDGSALPRSLKAMSLDLEQIRRNYEGFYDSQIEQIATNEVAALEPEVVSILKEEIRKRGLNTNLSRAIDAQTTQPTPSQVMEFKSRICSLPCPQCGGSNSPLVGALIREVKSFLFVTSYKRTPVIMCSTCAERRKSRALAVSLLMGWWGLPWGLIYTLDALLASGTDRKQREQQSEDILTDFVLKKFGKINLYVEQDSALSDLIRQANENR